MSELFNVDSISFSKSALFLLASFHAAAAAFSFVYTGGIQTFTVSTTGSYSILALGAQGGYFIQFISIVPIITDILAFIDDQ